MNLLRRIIHFLTSFIPPFMSKRMINCEQAALYLANENQLTGSLKYKIKLHTFLCLCCTNYKQQLAFIEKQSNKLGTITLTPEQKATLISSKVDIIKKYAK